MGPPIIRILSNHALLKGPSLSRRERRSLLHLYNLPQQNSLVIGGSCKHRAVGEKGRRGNEPRVPWQLVCNSTRLIIPNVGHSIRGATRHRLPRTGPGAAVNALLKVVRGAHENLRKGGKGTGYWRGTGILGLFPESACEEIGYVGRKRRREAPKAHAAARDDGSDWFSIKQSERSIAETRDCA